MSLRFSILSAILLGGMSLAQAKSLSAEEALLRVTDRPEAIKTLSLPSAGKYRLRYSAPKGEYYAFTTDGNRCLILSGDDRVEPVLADFAADDFTPDAMAPGAAWLLETYRKQIAAMPAENASSEKSAVKTSRNDIAALYSQWTDISPVMTCSWNQHSPYNLLTPIKEGSRCLTGCVATAMAQVIRTIGYARCSGYHSQGSGSEFVEYDYDANPIDFPNLLNSYNSSDSQESQLAVARLMLACGLSVNMGYSPSESGAQSSAVDYALVNNFGYDATHTRYLERINYTTVNWESIIYTELSLGRPVFYAAGSALSEGHAFVVDGYRGEGLWHVNWGWGGKSDGYFSFSLLTPSPDNFGDTNHGYNINQVMVKVVPPGADPGIAISTMFGSISKVAEGRYQVYYSGQGVAHSNVDLGAAIVAEDAVDKIIQWVPFWTSQSMGESVSVRDNYNFDFTDISLPSGNYRIYPATRDGGSDRAVICSETNGRQYYVELRVTPSGKYEISNPEGGQETAIYALTISEVQRSVLYSGYESELRMVVVNNGEADFLGTAILDLIAPDGSTVAFSKTIYGNTFPAGTNTLIDQVFNAVGTDYLPLPAGTYTIRLRKTDGEDLLAGQSPLTVTVLDTYPPNLHRGGGLTEVSNSLRIPSVMVTGEEWSHIPILDNDRQGKLELDVVFYRPGSNTPVRRYNICNRELGYFSGEFHYEPFIIDIPFGIYEVCYEANTITACPRQTVSVGELVGDMFYLPLSENSAAVCKSPDNDYEGEVTISPEITVNGIKYAVTAIAENAFSRCSDLTTIHIPSSVTSVGRNAFAYCPSLQNILFASPLPPLTQRNHIMPGASESVNIYAPSAAYDEYASLLDAYQPVFARIDRIQSRSVIINQPTATINISVTPIHPSINTEFIIEPLDNSLTAIEITSAEIIDGALRIGVKASQPGTSLFSISSSQPGVEPATLAVTFDSMSAITEIEYDPSTEILFDLQGRPSTSRQGYRIVITNGRARLVRF